MNSPRKQSPLTFFALVFALSLPFWGSGALSSQQLLPALPISALGFLCPLAGAAILIYREQGRSGVTGLLKRSFDFDRIKDKAWLAPAILLQPAIMVLSYGVIRLSGVPIPAPQIALLPVLALFGVFFITGLGEELGWSGYTTEPLQARYGPLGAGLLIGAVWAVWHFIPLLQAQRTWEWIAWWSLGTLSARVIIVWLYNQTGRSVFAAALFHAMINLTWQLFPVNGSFYDPRVTGLITTIAALVVAIAWGQRAQALVKVG